MGATFIQIKVMVVMITTTMSVVSTNECSKLDLQIWNYKSCPHPQSNEWNSLKEKMNCDNSKDLYYHCASDTHGCDVQLCLKRAYCQAGSGPLLDPSKDTAICALCPPDRYQTVGFWSNERSYCEREKTKCDGDGQIECQPGSTTTDRSCRCNVHENFILENYALHNATCCTENDQLCYCVKVTFPCSNGTVRHDNYRCMEQCPPNSFRRWDSERCYPNSTSEVAKDPMTTTSLTVSHVTTPGSPGIHTSMIVGIVLGSIACFIIAVLAGLYFCLQHRKNRRNKGKSCTNGHPCNGGPRNMADHHEDAVEVIHEVHVASTLSETEATEDDRLLQREAGPSADDTKMKEESTFINIENLTIIKKSTNTFVSGGRGDIILPENTPTENENNGTLESPENSNVRNSSVGENPENQNSHRPGYNLPQQETQGQGIQSLISTDSESEHIPVEHEENVEQHMRELKLYPESSLDESMEEVKPKEVWTPNDERNYSHDETKKKELF